MEEVQCLICLLSCNAVSIICLYKFLNKIVEIHRHLCKRALLRLEHRFHACKGISTLGIHKLNIIDSFRWICRCGITKPNAVGSGSLVDVLVEENISLCLEHHLSLFLTLCLRKLNILDIYLIARCRRICCGLGKRAYRQCRKKCCHNKQYR